MIQTIEGILPINKPAGKTSFSLVSLLRRITKVKKIGHTGTLDPFASGVLILLIGKKYTRLCDQLLCQDKEYSATIHLGITTDTYDIDGKVIERSSHIPTQQDIDHILQHFEGTILQTPPMFSAKKIQGKKLYELARKGITIERPLSQVTVSITPLSYTYPHLKIHVHCSKGTYIRALAHDIGCFLGCGAHLSALTRVKNGLFSLSECCDSERLIDPTYDWISYLRMV